MHIYNFLTHINIRSWYRIYIFYILQTHLHYIFYILYISIFSPPKIHSISGHFHFLWKLRYRFSVPSPKIFFLLSLQASPKHISSILMALYIMTTIIVFLDQNYFLSSRYERAASLLKSPLSCPKSNLTLILNQNLDFSPSELIASPPACRFSVNGTGDYLVASTPTT